MDGLTDLRHSDDEFHRAVGELVLSWARLEGRLAHLLNIIVDGGPEWAGRNLYYSQSNLAPRLELIGSKLREEISKNARLAPIWPRWRKLKKAIESEAGARRNRIIHGELVGFTDMANRTLQKRVVPYFGDRGRRPDPADLMNTFDVPEINQGKAAADQLFGAAQALGEHLCVIAVGSLDQTFARRFDGYISAAKPSALHQ